MTALFKLPLANRMPTTMELLDMALEKDSLRAWSRRLGLSEEALRTARSRGRLSPVVAGCLAEDLKQDPLMWMVISVLETERESACKTRMIQRFKNTFSASQAERRKLEHAWRSVDAGDTAGQSS